MKKRNPCSRVVTALTVLAAICAAVVLLLVALVLWRTVDWQTGKTEPIQTSTVLSSAAVSDTTYEAIVQPSPSAVPDLPSSANAASPVTEPAPPSDPNAASPAAAPAPPSGADAAPDRVAAPADAPSFDTPSAVAAPTSQEPYGELLCRYAAAISEQWDPGRMIQAGLNYMSAEYHHGNPAQDIGYAKLDLDGDGRVELVVAPRVEDEFFGKMIFALYSLDESGAPRLIFESTERNRYYYAGGNHFANLGASSFDSSYVTTLKLQEGEMIDMTYTTQPADYVQLALTPFA